MEMALVEMSLRYGLLLVDRRGRASSPSDSPPISPNQAPLFSTRASR